MLKLIVLFAVFSMLAVVSGLVDAGNKKEIPRLLKLKIYLDDLQVQTFQTLYGTNYKPKATIEITKLLKSASTYLKRLDHGGFDLKMDGLLMELSQSSFYPIGKTFIDRLRDNREKPLDVNREDFTEGFAFALQEKIKTMKNYKQSPDTLDFFLTPKKWGRHFGAATEENCVCKDHPDYPCIGTFGLDKFVDEGSAVLLAHEVGHALGAEMHDPKWSNTIMNPIVKPGYTWSQKSKDQINRQDNTCLMKM